MKPSKLTRIALLSTTGALAGLAMSFSNPVNSKLHNLLFIAFILVTWGSLLTLSWRFFKIRIGLLSLPILLAIPFCLPARSIDSDKLRKDYVRNMLGHEGVEYYWGGENSKGIDCSGLPRRSFRDSLLSHGFRTGDGRAFRAYLEHWWFDSSAQALGEGYREYTEPVQVGGKIREMSYGDLLPGDIAITDSGIHALVYVGDNQWIQACPAIGMVQTQDGRTGKSSWFNLPVSIHRWKLLEQ